MPHEPNPVLYQVPVMILKGHGNATGSELTLAHLRPNQEVSNSVACGVITANGGVWCGQSGNHEGHNREKGGEEPHDIWSEGMAREILE